MEPGLGKKCCSPYNPLTNRLDILKSPKQETKSFIYLNQQF